MVTSLLGMVAASFSASAATSNYVSFSLVATVPVMCSVQSVATAPGRFDELDVVANCNAEQFELVLGGDIGTLTIESVVAASGDARAMDRRVVSRADRPGLQSFRIKLSDDLDASLSPSISIAAL